MKIAEQAFEQDGKLIIKQTHDFQPILNKAAMLRSSGAVGPAKHSKHIASVPMVMVDEWLKEAGVSWDDREAAQQVLKRKLLDGEFAKFRVWEGTY